MFQTSLPNAVKSQHTANRAYPENTNFVTFEHRELKFHTFVDLHTIKKMLKIST